MVEEQVFLMKPKHKNHLSQWEECVYGAQWRKERRLLCQSLFIPIEISTSNLKMVKREVFLTKPKHQNCLSQQVECVYSAQSSIERRSLHEFTFIPIERWTSILKMVEREVFLTMPKHQNVYPNKKNVIMVSNLEKNGDYYVNPRLSQLKNKLEF